MSSDLVPANPNIAGEQTRAMNYNGLDRLTQTTSPSAVFNTAAYSCDVLDNLLSVNVTGGSQARNHTYVYDATTRCLSQVKNTVGGAVVANLTWDVQGNLSGKGPSGAVQSYSFDLGNRLVAYRERQLSSTRATLKYQHTGDRGSTSAVTNAAMTVEVRYSIVCLAALLLVGCAALEASCGTDDPGKHGVGFGKSYCPEAIPPGQHPQAGA